MTDLLTISHNIHLDHPKSEPWRAALGALLGMTLDPDTTWFVELGGASNAANKPGYLGLVVEGVVLADDLSSATEAAYERWPVYNGQFLQLTPFRKAGVQLRRRVANTVSAPFRMGAFADDARTMFAAHRGIEESERTNPTRPRMTGREEEMAMEHITRSDPAEYTDLMLRAYGPYLHLELVEGDTAVFLTEQAVALWERSGQPLSADERDALYEDTSRWLRAHSH